MTEVHVEMSSRIISVWLTGLFPLLHSCFATNIPWKYHMAGHDNQRMRVIKVFLQASQMQKKTY